MSLQVPSLVDQTNQGAGTAVPMSQAMNAERITYYVIFNPGVTAGVVRIETAHNDSHSGEWAKVVDVDASSLAENMAFGTIDGPLGAIRGRITTAISGGGDPGVTVIFLLAGDI